MRMTIPALTAALLISTAAIAEDKANSAIDALPERGLITLSGTVDRVTDEDTFILRDNSGKTIDVHTVQAARVKAGDKVTVKGEKTDEIAGFGEEITSATLVESNATDKTAASTDAERTSGMDLASADGSARAPQETPYAQRNNQNTPPNTAYDVNVDRTDDGIHISADRTADVERNAAGVGLPAGTVDKSSDVRSTERQSANLDTIDALPPQGQVQLNGTVASVDGQSTFTLEDAAGKTINVESASALSVKEGDTVAVNGMLNDRFLGFGRKIESAEVIVVGSN